MEELRSCPFCGSSNVNNLPSIQGDQAVWFPAEITCEQCGANTNSVEQWNTRSTDPLLVAEIARLKNQNLRIVRGEFNQICSYCGWESPGDGDSWDALQSHIRNCEYHPLTQANALLEEMARALGKARQYIDRSYYYTSHGPTIFNTIDQALQKYREATHE
jgi:phosphatidylserine/phosphatidylglycerophosphate/cardiolipin synthase-like enzyme